MLCLMALPGFAQGLYPQLTHIPLDAIREEARYGQLAMAVDRAGFLIVGKSDGVYRFDGRRLDRLVDLMGVVAIHADTSSGSLLVACRSGLVLMQPLEFGGYRTQVLDTMQSGALATIRLLPWGRRVVMATESSIRVLEFRSARTSFQPVSLPKSAQLKGVAMVGAELWVNLAAGGLHQLTENRLVPIAGAAAWAQRTIAWSATMSPTTSIIGTTTASGRVELWRASPGRLPEPTAGRVTERLQAAGLYRLAALPGGLLVVGTLRRGALLIDTRSTSQSGQIIAALDSTSGSPITNLYGMATDSRGAIWLAHDGGLTHATTDPSVSDYSFISPLNGTLYTLAVHQGWLYAGTSAGLFALPVRELAPGLGLGVTASRKNDAIAEQIISRLEQAASRKDLKRNSDNTKTKAVVGPKSKLAPKAAPTPAVPVQLGPADLTTLATARVRWRMVRGLRSACYQVVSSGNTLAAATLSGAYFVREDAATLAGLEFRYVQALLPSSVVPGRWYAALGSGQGVQVLERNGEALESVASIPLPAVGSITLNSLTEDAAGNLWLGSDRGVHVASWGASSKAVARKEPGKLAVAGGLKPTWRSFGLSSAGAERSAKVINLLGGPVAISATGVYLLDSKGPKRSALFSSLNRPRSSWVSRTRSEAWVATADTLFRIRRGASEGLEVDTSYLIGGIGPSTDALSSADGAGVWAVVSRRLVRLRPELKRKAVAPQLALLSAELRSGAVAVMPTSELAYRNNSVDLSLGVADYTQPERVRYQQRVLSEDEPAATQAAHPWGPWTESHRLSLANLTQGDYRIELRGRTASGELTAVRALRIAVAAPWYLTPWAIGLAIVMLGGGGFGLVRIADSQRRKQIARLDRLVREKTENLEAQNALLAEQSLKMTWQRDELDTKLAELARTNGELESAHAALEASSHSLAETNYRLGDSIATIQLTNAELQKALEENALQRALVEAKNAELGQSLDTIQRQQEQLVQSEKMAALGLLIAGVAHEINSPLGAIKGTAQTLFLSLPHTLEQLPRLLRSMDDAQASAFEVLLGQCMQHSQALSTREVRQLREQVVVQLVNQSLPHGDPIPDLLVRLGATEHLDAISPLLRQPQAVDWLEAALGLAKAPRGLQTILQSAEKTQRIVTTLRSYVRTGQQGGEQLPPEAFDVADTLELVLTLYGGNLRGIEVDRHFEAVPKVMGRPERLVQVWTNLIVNSVQALEQHRLADPDAPRSRITLDLAQRGTHVQITISDNGPGIPEEHQRRVFEQFFTTKPAGEGTGLGLSISRQIVQEHGGTLELVSHPGMTRFTILLPSATGTLQPALAVTSAHSI
jgi:signal transduction histidine kinase